MFIQVNIKCSINENWCSYIFLNKSATIQAKKDSFRVKEKFQIVMNSNK